MSIIKCIECGKDVSDTASSCNGCGANLKNTKKLAHVEDNIGFYKFLAFVIRLVGGVFAFLVFIFGGLFFVATGGKGGLLLLIGGVIAFFLGILAVAENLIWKSAVLECLYDIRNNK